MVIRRRRSRRASRRWLVAAAVLGLVALASGVLAWLLDPEVEAARGTPHELVAATPLLSARRTPDLLVRPVAARNLREAVAPILAAAPATTCLEVREGSSPLVAHNADQPVIPASNLKLVIAAAALDLMDPQERLVTRFATDGTPTDGSVVRGNLYMVGGGDPLLTSDTYEPRFNRGVPPITDLESVADRIAGTGITQVTGSIVGDASRYDDVRTAPGWPERYFTQGQVAPLSALLVNDGWGVDAITGAGGGPVPDPAVHAAEVMTDLLEARGVDVAGPPMAGTAPEGAPTLVEIPSLTIAELVGQLLAFSDNTTTELLVKELGVRSGQGGSTAAGLAAVTGWMAERDLDAEGVSFEDASGLSANDRATCGLLSDVLVDEGPSGPVADGLARPGQPGTLDDRLLAAPLPEAVRAKTGTLLEATALSGWLRTVPGRDLAFAFVINTPGGQVGASHAALQQQLLQAMLDHPRTPPVDQLSPLAPVPST
jgi:D-alanyl-D-alanine carboxypeptidase/D-alanyl-D-alanine-endopeptidase (penicillin-binding protein 4)